MINNTNEFIIYAMQVNLVWMVALLFYNLLLKGETFFHLNRIFLIGSVFLGLVTPFLGTFIQSLFESESPIFTGTILNADEVEVFANQISTPTFNFVDFILLIFWIGFGIQLIKITVGLIDIYKLHKTAESRIENVIVSSQIHQPFSFLNQVFISNRFIYSEKEREIIIKHEQQHILMGHTWDILAFELIKSVFWYSPFIYYFQKQLKLVHEFQVDAMVLKNVDKFTYGQILVNQVYLNKQYKIANHFIFSQLKTRIDMMTKSKSSKNAILKYVLAIPLFAAFLFIFNLDSVIAESYNSFVINEPNHTNSTKIAIDTEDPIYKVVDQMPRFPGCESEEDKEDLKKCSDKKMLNFIYSHIKYPQEARVKGIQGMTVIQFIVEKDGSISKAKIVRNIEGGCGEEALRIVGSMPKWIPGREDGKAVRVQFNVPIKFKLSTESAKPPVPPTPPAPPTPPTPRK